MSKSFKHISIALPNGSLAACRPCTCGAENNLTTPHVRSCELYTDYADALTDELVYGDDFEPQGDKSKDSLH